MERQHRLHQGNGLLDGIAVHHLGRGRGRGAWPRDVLYAIHQCAQAPSAARAGSYHRYAQIFFQRSQIYVDFFLFRLIQ